MRRPDQVEQAILNAVRQIDGPDDLKIRYSDSEGWMLVTDTYPTEVVAKSATVSGLEAAYKNFLRKQRNAKFKRVKVIVVAKYAHDLYVGEVTSWVLGSKTMVWVSKDNSTATGHRSKEQVAIERCRVYDESALETLVELKTDRGIIDAKIKRELNRLFDVLPTYVFDDKNHPRIT